MSITNISDEKIEWFDEEYDEETGITKVAIKTETYSWGGSHQEAYGYNDMVEGDLVSHNGEEWTIVMVSRLGDFGLSKTGQLPYTIRVFPNEVTKVIVEGDGK